MSPEKIKSAKMNRIRFAPYPNDNGFLLAEVQVGKPRAA